MKERPILFSAPMVRALLDGSKTQTRQALPAPESVTALKHFEGLRWDRMQGDQRGDTINCPYGQPGDRLWVRENFMDLQGTGVEHRPDPSGPLRRYAYRADTPSGSYGDDARKEYRLKWKPSIHMPRNACRITLEITSVRVERLQDISRGDSLNEGIVKTAGGFGLPAGQHYNAEDPRDSYFSLWESINGPGSVMLNPWVWVVEFKKVTA